MSCEFPVVDSMVRIIDSGQTVSFEDMATEVTTHAGRVHTLEKAVPRCDPPRRRS